MTLINDSILYWYLGYIILRSIFYIATMEYRDKKDKQKKIDKIKKMGSKIRREHIKKQKELIDTLKNRRN